MSKRVVGATVEAPKGWRFSARFLVPEVENTFNAELFDAVYAWAKRHKYGLVPSNDHYFYLPNGVTVYCHYEVYTDAWDRTLELFGDGTWEVKGKKISLGETEV